MNWVDWVILAIAGFSTFAGFMDGFVKSVLSLASIVVAFFAASHFANPIGIMLEKWLHPTIAHPAGFTLVFSLVLIAFALVSVLVRGVIDKVHLGGFDRLLGAVLGFVRAAVVLGLVAFLVQGFGSFSATRASKTFPYALRSGDMLLKAVPQGVKSRLQWKRVDLDKSKGAGEKKKADDGGVI